MVVDYILSTYGTKSAYYLKSVKHQPADSLLKVKKTVIHQSLQVFCLYKCVYHVLLVCVVFGAALQHLRVVTLDTALRQQEGMDYQTFN